jgi:hypothetical protein
MLITSVVGLLTNIINFCALNCACGSKGFEIEEEDEAKNETKSEQDDWTIGE